MQGLVNFTTAIADSIAVALPAFCYLMACSCFFFAGWTFRGWAYHHHSHHHHFHNRPWVPFISLALWRRVRDISAIPEHGQCERGH